MDVAGQSAGVRAGVRARARGGRRRARRQADRAVRGDAPTRANRAPVASALRLEGEAVYAASKAAIENLTQTISKEVASFNITINEIGPTPVETDLIKAVPKNKMDDLINKQTIKRFGTFEDVKNVIDFFIDDKSDFITGQIIYLGGIYN